DARTGPQGRVPHRRPGRAQSARGGVRPRPRETSRRRARRRLAAVARVRDAAPLGLALAASGNVTATLAARVGRLPWDAMEKDLLEEGYAHVSAVLTAAECRDLVGLYGEDDRFRSRVDMARHRFGEGDYKYFRRPLPPLVEALRRRAYPPLAAIANRWMVALGASTRFPPDLEAFLATCRKAGQTEPTPLLLHYEAGGYNCLHQDLYGEVAFP